MNVPLLRGAGGGRHCVRTTRWWALLAGPLNFTHNRHLQMANIVPPQPKVVQLRIMRRVRAHRCSLYCMACGV